MKKTTIFLILGMLMIAISIYLYPSLPDQIPTHWGVTGVDAYGHKQQLFMPILLYLLFLIPVCIIDRKAIRNKRVANTLMMFMAFVFLVVWCMSIVSSFYPLYLNGMLMCVILLGIMLIVTGNLMPKIKFNYFIGIRTPWTLMNETVWYKTHRLGGKAFFFGGWIFLLGLLVPTNLVPAFMIFMMITLTGIPLVYSYFCFHSLLNPQEVDERKENL